MDWKNWPFWLKGLIIGAGIIAVIYLISMIFLNAFFDYCVLPLNLLRDGEFSFSPCVLAYAVNNSWRILLVIFAVLGVLVSWVIRKIRK
jgi:H+/Cl- antiporter ClcA